MVTCFPSAHHNYPVIWLNFCFFFFLGFQSLFLWGKSSLAIPAALHWQSPLKRQRSGFVAWARASSLRALSQCSQSPRTQTRLLSLWRWSAEIRPPAWLPSVLPIKAADGFVSVRRLISWSDMDVKPACSQFVVFSKWKIIDKFSFSPWGDEIPSITQNLVKTFREVFSGTQLRFKKLAKNSGPSVG